jgi:hypothetical protein
MNTQQMTQSLSRDPSHQRAKVVLWVAFGVFFVSQFFPYASFTSSRGWFFEWIIKLVKGVCGMRPIGLSDPWVDRGVQLIQLSLNLFILASLAGAPWLVTRLRQGRPILWILRILMLMWLLAHAYSCYINLKLSTGVHLNDYSYLQGYWLYLTAIVLNTIGLWMIPKAVKHQPFIAPEMPTADEQR